MSTENDPEENVVCSFCGKMPKDIEVMIAGEADLAICNECVQLCVAIIENKKNWRNSVFPNSGRKVPATEGRIAAPYKNAERLADPGSRVVCNRALCNCLFTKR